MDRSLAVTTCCFALISLPLGAAPPKMAKAVSAAALPSDDELGEKITDTELRRLDNLRHYTVVRKYNLHNSHMEQDAVMTVRLNYEKDAGKSFEIINIDTASGMARHVLERLVDSEAQQSRKKAHDEFEITSANYSFHAIGTDVRAGRRCYIVELKPKRKSKYLIQGKAWVDAQDFGLVRLEGRPAASLSMWVGRPYIVQDFEKVGPFWMASSNRSESQNWILGSSVLTVDSSRYEVEPSPRVAEIEMRRHKTVAE